VSSSAYRACGHLEIGELDSIASDVLTQLHNYEMLLLPVSGFGWARADFDERIDEADLADLRAARMPAERSVLGRRAGQSEGFGNAVTWFPNQFRARNCPNKLDEGFVKEARIVDSYPPSPVWVTRPLR
jgi:hypothetical protein